MMTKRFHPRLALAALAAIAALGGCASPADRIASKLVELGVPPGPARCMGTRLDQRLTTSQLRELGRVANVDRESVGRMSIRDIVHRLRGIDDPKLVTEVLRAGVGCSI